jgi:hypothetical protein
MYFKRMLLDLIEDNAIKKVLPILTGLSNVLNE